MISLIIGCMEASIEIMKKLIPIVLMIMYYAFIVLPVAIFHGIVEVVRSMYHRRSRRYLMRSRWNLRGRNLRHGT